MISGLAISGLAISGLAISGLAISGLAISGLAISGLLSLPSTLAAAETERLRIPDRLVVLTFDDGNQSDSTFVAPLLKQLGFNATFYVNSGSVGTPGRLTWEDVRQLQRDGFEIGNHSHSHPNMLHLTEEQTLHEISQFDQLGAQHGIAKATSFAYPGAHHDRKTIAALVKLGYTNARRGTDPEYPLVDEGGPGIVYLPGQEDPFLIPSTFIRGTPTTFEEIKQAVQKAKNEKICVLTFHGVPDVHRHCSTPPEVFREYMQYLHDHDYRVIAIRDLANYVDFSIRPADPYAPIKARLGITPTELKCEPTIGPDGKVIGVPSFHWFLTSSRRSQLQAAFQILVASSHEKLERHVGDLWDSGKVDSDHTFDIEYGGKPLQSGQRCWWKVRSWNKPNQLAQDQVAYYINAEILEEMRKSIPGHYSQHATFEMATLPPAADKGALIDKEGVISVPKQTAREVRIRPIASGDFKRHETSLTTRRGVVRVDWQRTEDGFALRTTVPANMTAAVYLPKLGWQNVLVGSGAADLWKEGRLVDRLHGITEGKEDANRVELRIGSGDYQLYLMRAD